VLVTGATGYIGGRLVPRLLEKGWRVRCLARDPRKLGARTWHGDPGVEVVEGEVGDEEALARALGGCKAAYYLVHSMMRAGRGFSQHDRALAEGFAGAAGRAGVERILYLGGLGETGAGLSEHLASRREVERALATGPADVTTFRAAIILGSGSASFEILRYLVERLPVMVTPRWVRTECQPIAVGNVLTYLVDALEVEETRGRTLDIGGPEVVTYRDMMRMMAQALRLGPRLVLPVPVLTPRLSSLWIHLVTPIPARIARPLAEGLRNRVVCRDDAALRLVPQRLLGVRESIDAALAHEVSGNLESWWADAGTVPGDPDWAGGTILEDRRRAVARADARACFRAVCRLGGRHGYYASDGLWRVRGALDRLVGGPGLRRGRRSPDDIAFGDALDFWRVTALVPDHRLELRAEMRLPGVATLSFDLAPEGPDRTAITQTARFLPRGLLGLLYWHAALPLHGRVFEGMLRGIRSHAEATATTRSPSP
jgi:uncharacterized protein YbjT (DUF2867 family)